MKINELITENFGAYNLNNNPPTKISGLTFSYNIFANGLTSDVSVSIAETSSTGIYSLSFTPNLTGVWFVEMTSASAVMNAEYFIEDNFISMIEDMHDVNLGKWEMTNNQLKMYREDNSVLKVFDLFNIGGSPSLTGVTKRVPV